MFPAAGLTVAAVKDPGGEWVLEAGALVLADGGVCCIDEFNCISTNDRATIHEAMEQQTLSVAKAGIVCKLNTRATIVAACNPKGSYDIAEALDVNVGIASPLLSRFDIILVLIDHKIETWDREVAAFISGDNQVDSDIWGLDRMKTYVSYVRDRFKPLLSEEAYLLLKAYFHRQRKRENGHCARTTIRFLESLVRVSQAHARLMFRDDVLLEVLTTP